MAEKSNAKSERFILRWHLSRIYEEERFGAPGSRPVDVSVRPWRPSHAGRLAKEGIACLSGVLSEDLQWWSDDEKEQLLGWTEERLLLDAVQRNNAAVPAEEAARLEVPRQLVEDMVLVQELADPRPWYEASAKSCQYEDQLNLEALVQAPDSLWLDLTLPARAATKTLYRRVLGEVGSVEQERDDAKQR